MKTKSLMGLAATLLVLLTISFFMSGSNDVVPLVEEPPVVQPEEDAPLNEEVAPEPVDAKPGDEEPPLMIEPPSEPSDETQEREEPTEPVIESPVNEEPVATDEPDEAVAQAPPTIEPPLEDDTLPEQEAPSSGNEMNPPTQEPTPEEPAKELEEPASEEKDQYLTDPVPEGKPEPVEWQDVTVDSGKSHTATLSVTAKTILNNLEMFNEDKLEVLPDDGVIYAEQTVTFSEGESVFDVLLREMQEQRIHMEFVMTPIYNSHYIKGINNIYEFDCGELSGWMYKVNGWFPNYGASRYQVEPGDDIAWVYTCDLGRDIGGYGATNGG